jgi:hypothetical protein
MKYISKTKCFKTQCWKRGGFWPNCWQNANIHYKNKNENRRLSWIQNLIMPFVQW